MKYQKAVSFLTEAGRFRINPSLKNISEFLLYTGLTPEFEVIQVSGTNGKTSTAVMTAALLSSSGKRTGLFVSPHVLHYGERFAVDGRMLSRDEFGMQLEGFIEQYEHDINRFQLTEFEILTAFAVWLFNHRQVDVAVMETGLGGRFDAVSALGARLGILTGVARDHAHILGESLEEIAREKLYPFRRKTVVFAPDINGEIHRLSREMAVKVVSPDESTRSIRVFPAGTEVITDRRRFFIPLCGREYAANALAALTAARIFTTSRANPQALEEIFIPARFQITGIDDSTVVVDGAHNEQAVISVVHTFRQVFPEIRPAVICGFMKDKDYLKMISALRQLEPVRITAVEIPSAGSRGLDARATGLEAASGLEAAFEVASEASGHILVTGSLYLAGDFLAFIKQTFKIEVEKLNYYIS